MAVCGIALAVFSVPSDPCLESSDPSEVDSNVEKTLTEYDFSEDEEKPIAKNRIHGLRVELRDDSVELASFRPSSWVVDMRLRGVKRGKASKADQPSLRNIAGNRVEYRRGNITEWYTNEPAGLSRVLPFKKNRLDMGTAF